MDFGKLPNFFIIGAAKSGTTSLFEIVGEHPSVFAATKKEIKFFSNDDRFEEGVDWYQETHFSNAGKFPVRMEASPAYLTWSQKAAPRMKDLYQDRPLKFAVIFRDPVKRAYSHYWDRVRQGDEPLPFTEAIHAEESRLKENWEVLHHDGNGLYGYFRAGCYATRLKPYLDLFPRESFFYLLQEDLINDFDRSMASLLSFLEIEHRQALKVVKRNEAAVPRYKSVYNLYRRVKQSKVQSLLRRFLPKRMRKQLRHNLILKPIRYPAMPDDIKKELYARYIDEVRQLEPLIGRDLSNWYTG
jgi:hypothetical protein